MSKTKPDLDLNSDMIVCPNFKFGHKFGDHTRFFSSRTISGNRVEQIFACPKYKVCHLKKVHIRS